MNEPKLRPCINCRGPIRCELCGTLQTEHLNEGMVELEVVRCALNGTLHPVDPEDEPKYGEDRFVILVPAEPDEREKLIGGEG